jgi:EAL domain-containing protein (putative c-di-GMP-specific phosphodiesterase class I)
LRIVAAARSRPPVVLIGNVDARLVQNVRRLATKLGVETVAHSQAPVEDRHESAALERVMRSLTEPGAADLRRAIDEQQLVLHYQPKFTAAKAGTVAGVEALIRWNHPDFGLLLPSRFLPRAESAGLLPDVTDFTITEAMRQHALWRDRGIDLPIAVNLAPELIKDDRFPDRLMASLRQFDVPPSRLTLDVKETGRLADRSLCTDALTRLRFAGVGLALDDYGVGLSSLTELYRMPFTEVKIDGALVADAAYIEDADIVLNAIIRLAHELSIVATAEGVETRSQIDRVVAHGCDFAQGMWLCEPRGAADLARFLASATMPRS